jgi:hypothetical protein
LSDVADLLADLIPDVGYISALDRALEGDENRRRAGNGIAADVVETRGFLELLLDLVCDLLERIRYFGTGPRDLDHHGLDRKGGVFITAQSQIGQSARRNDDDDQKPDE